MNISKVKFILLLIVLPWCHAVPADVVDKQMQLVGSTPGDQEIKILLGIDPKTPVDFIRWNLVLTAPQVDSGEFTLNLQYGMSQPNTPGFINNGTSLHMTGRFSVVSKKIGYAESEVYQLVFSPSSTISLVRINENVFHLLSSDGSLMVGNGGWSYSLNKAGENVNLKKLTSFVQSAFADADTSTRIIFDGRSPCKEIALDGRLSVAEDCFKLKWRFIFERDPKTLQPTRYTVERTDKRRSAIKGTWSLVTDNSKHTDAIIYRLQPDDGNSVVYMLAGDHNVIFFLDKNLNLLTGNQEYSYAANRKLSK